MIFISIIGGGPCGIYALSKFKEIFKNQNIVLFEKKNLLNNLQNMPNVLWYSPLKSLTYDIDDDNNTQPTTKTLIDYYKNWINTNSITFIKENIVDIKKNNNVYKIICESGNSFISKYIILSTGMYNNNNTLKINTNFNFISYYNEDFSLKNKNIVLIGSSYSAIDFIIKTLPYNKIYWVYRNNKPVDIENCEIGLNFKNIISKYSFNLQKFSNTNVIKFDDNQVYLSNKQILNNIDKCYILIGFNSVNSLNNKIGIKYTKNNYIQLDNNYHSNLKNIFVIGALANNKKNIWPGPIYINKGNLIMIETIARYIISNNF